MTTYADLWAKLGAIFKRASDIRTAQRAFAPVDLVTASGLNVIRDAYEPEEMTLLNSVSDAESLGDFGRPALESLRRAAHQTLIEIVRANASPQIPTLTLADAFREMAAMLVNESDSLDGNDISVSVAARSGNTGAGTVLATPIAPVYMSRGIGLTSATEGQFIRGEKWRITCIGDANAGYAAGNERFKIDTSIGYDNLHRRWRSGSGAGTVFLSATYALTVEASPLPGQNILVNSAFERAAVANTPDRWTARTGSFGTDIATTATAWDGSLAVRLVGGGTSNPAIGQLMKSTSGTPIAILPDTTYAVSALTRSNSGTINKEVTFQFADSGGTSVGLTGAASVVASSHTTSYSRTSGYIHTPTNLTPGTYYFDIRNTSTALSGGEEIYIDGLIVAPVVRVAPQSGGIVVVGGATQFRSADHFDIEWTNDDAGDLLYWADCLFDCYGNGFVLPINTAGSETLADTLFA